MFTLIKNFWRYITIRRLIKGEIDFLDVTDSSLVIDALKQDRDNILARSIIYTVDVPECIQYYMARNYNNFGILRFSDNIQTLICNCYPEKIPQIPNPNEFTTIHMIRNKLHNDYSVSIVNNIYGHLPFRICELLHTSISKNELSIILSKRLYSSLSDSELEDLIVIHKLAS